jgi:hypothetical protein
VPIQPKQPTARGPAGWFTGDVFIDAIVRGESRGGAIEEIRAGDVVSTPPDEWHWHGAAPDHLMTHLSITEAVPGDRRPEAEWGEHVTDDEYAADQPAGRRRQGAS